MADITKQNKVISLFQFIGELNKLKQRAILNYKDNLYSFEISDLPDDPDNIKIYYRDRAEEGIVEFAEDNNEILLSVHKPEFQKCPNPDLIFRDWLNLGWDKFHNSASVKESISFERAFVSRVENFTDSRERVVRYEAWLKRRDIWIEKQKIIEATRKLFDKLYSIYFELQRESETEEIIVANGILCDRDNPKINHPVLTHRVKLDYDTDKNTIFILDTPVPSEIDSTAINTLEKVNNINDLLEDLQENDYHPLDRNDTPKFLKKLVHQLSSESIFSDFGVPSNWKNNNRLLLYIAPIYIVRKRPDGTLKAIDQIISNIQNTGEIPAPVRDIVSGGKFEIPENTVKESVEEQLAAIGGESVDILLSKEANREQLEIARRIENYNAVLVQGPPGTGKTHTIANLMGHFLAQGKSVLVTSHTTKALKVLKDKVAPNLQSLCVSMIDDSNIDMERSIDGISSYISSTNFDKLEREMNIIAEERRDIIQNLADVRRKIFQIIHQECNCIVYNGEGITPSQAAKFVEDNAESLSYIPGKVRLRTPLPLTFAQLTDLYRSNENLSAEDEIELESNLPSPDLIMQPAVFSATWENLQNARNIIENVSTQNNWKIDTEKNYIRIKGKFGNFSAPIPKVQDIQYLMKYINSLEKLDNWMKVAAVDGKKGGEYRNRWLTLINQIQTVNDYAEKIMAEQFETNVQFLETSDIGLHKAIFEEMHSIFSDNEEIIWFKKFLNKKYALDLSDEAEKELVNNLPSHERIMQPEDFSFTLGKLKKLQRQIENISTQNNLKVTHNEDLINITGKFGNFSAELPKVESVRNLMEYISSFGKIDKWMKFAAVAGKKGGEYRKRWLTLINQIQKVSDYAEKIMTEQFEANVKFLGTSDIEPYKAIFEEMHDMFSTDGKISWFKKFLNKKYDNALKSFTINGKKPHSAQDCEIILHYIELNELRKQCAKYWDNLLAADDVPKFFALDEDNPENIAKGYIPLIEKYLNWYRDVYKPLSDKLTAVNLPEDVVFEKNSLDSDIGEIEKIFSAIKTVIPAICDIFVAAIEKENYSAVINKTEKIVSYGKCRNSKICKAVLSAINNNDNNEYSAAYSELKRMYEKYYDRSDKYILSLKSVTLNGKTANSAKDCEVVLHKIELNELRKQCAKYWDNLLAANGVPKFFELDADNPEDVAKGYTALIKEYLDWDKNAYQPLLTKMNLVGIPAEVIESYSLNFEIDKILFTIKNVIPAICNIFKAITDKENYSAKIIEEKSVLSTGKRGGSRICRGILSALNNGDTNAYATTFAELKRMYEKYELQKTRAELLKKLEPVAPQWADAIRHRKGIHGQFTVPSDIEDAWKWKQLFGIVEEITEKPFVELQADSLRLSKEYRRITADYAEKCSWYHLLKKISNVQGMQNALQGWKQSIKKVGKGTGKQAPKHKAAARERMAECQKAVPAWIMPINRALETLNPKENRFDVIIIDEASQSDISSLAILYMGKKLIIVGDDKQVSPMAVGVDVDKTDKLQQLYLNGKIPNANLYDGKTSIYDIAATTFQPLMLKEHFRCVPEIIGFSNMLSYNYKIKPLREAGSSNLLPAVVNYRVADGRREGKSKTNPNEAKAIVAIMKACMEQPEYLGKSFGVISLLGDEGGQVKLISNLIEQKIDPKEIQQRKILCGNSANFQGDERDVIFLSMVDSGDDDGPIRMMNSGIEDANRKRYNVAVSRARDQIWVVNSLDSANDLKTGDIRKILIDYAINPHSAEIEHSKIEEQAESPFEASVAKNLVDRGYHIVQQWKVGAYRLDMVAVCGKNTVAIECDGERWHSGESKIREDMERQTILERIGWKFIRIRGSEYYRNSEKTIARVISELSKFEIEPEETGVITSENRETELLNRVKNRAAIIMSNDNFSDENFEDILNVPVINNYNLNVGTTKTINNRKLNSVPQNINVPTKSV